MEAIVTKSICKHFGDTHAAKEISIHVKKGEIYGFLGLNGAGKTTLIRMLLGMVKPASGDIEIFGEKLNRNFNQWNRIGYLVETPFSYPQLTVYENLEICYQLRGLTNPQCIDEVIERLKLTPYRNKKAGVLSLGNQQRLGLAKALIHKPELLILDEPINGLDPEGIVEIRELLKSLAKNGVSIFISSHILDEIAKIANRIGIIHKGVLLKELETEELSRLLNRKLVIDCVNNATALHVLDSAGHLVAKNQSGELELMNSSAYNYPENIVKLLSDKEVYAKKILVSTEDLEEFFLRTIKQTI